MIRLETMNFSQKELKLACDNKRVLIVDDEAAILFAYQKLIEGEGYVVDVCESLEVCMANIRSYDYCAVISDMRLAGSENADGLKVINAIKESQPTAKIILVTGYGNAEIEQMAYNFGASHYFEKPVQPSLILDALKSMFSSVLIVSNLPDIV